MNKLSKPKNRTPVMKKYELWIIHSDDTESKVDNPADPSGLFNEEFEAILYAQTELALDEFDSISPRLYKVKR